MNIDVNYLGVFLAAVASMIIGFLWYSNLLFAKPWMKLMGYTKESMSKAQKEMGSMYAISFVVSLVTAYMMSHVMSLSEHYFGYPLLMTGLTTAFFMWLGFVMPVQLTDVLFGRKSRDLFYINTGYQLASLIGMGIVLAVI